MAELKTQPTRASVTAFISEVTPEERRADCKTLHKLMRKVTGAKATMWGTSIVGYGQYRYKYATGREGDWFFVGFSPRAQNLTIYVMGGLAQHAELLAKMGKVKPSGGGCLYVKRLAEIDMKVLTTLLTRAFTSLKKRTAG